MDRSSRFLPLLFAVILIAAGLAAWRYMQDRDDYLDMPGAHGVSPEGGSDASPDPALREKVAVLETALALSNKRVRQLEKKLGIEPGASLAGGKEQTNSKDFIDSGKKAGKGEKEGSKTWDKAKKGKGKIGLPEGMTRQEQDARVREIVDGHDWERSVGAMLSWERSREGGRGVSMDDKESIGEFLELIGQLNEVGVDFFDPRVTRRHAPARIDAMGADLSDRQAGQISQFVDDTAARTAAEPRPDGPLLYADQKASELGQVLALERHMETILRPEQVQAYLAEVGDNPFRDGFGFKTARFSCTGATLDEVASEVAQIWCQIYGIPEASRPMANTGALDYVNQILNAPPVTIEGSPARRHAMIERAIARLEAQASAERALLETVPMTEEQRASAHEAQCPVLDLVLERKITLQEN